MIPVLHVIFTIPCFGKHPSVDIYEIFVFEPMHKLSLGISELLKKWLVSYLKDDKKVSKSINTISGEGRIISLVKKPVISPLNAFIRVVQCSSPGFGLNLDVSKGLTAGLLSGLFTDDGILGILGETDH